MKLHKVADSEAVARLAADRFETLVGAISQTKAPVLGLPTGRTAVPFYAELRLRKERGNLDLSKARSFNLDELLLPAGHPGSFRAFMERHAWELIGLDRDHCEIPRSNSDPEAECQRYEQALTEAGGLDLAVLGVGADGHVAYNLPGTPTYETHVVEVPDAVADTLCVDERHRPLRAITLGLGSLMNARHVLLMATGAAKAPAIRALFDGPRDPQWPCSLLGTHPNFDVIVDQVCFERASVESD